MSGLSPLDPTSDPFAEARQNVSNDWASVFSGLNDQLGLIQNQAGPTPQAIPPALHPIGQMAAAFASTLAEQMGARGSVAAHENRVQTNNENIQRVQQQNFLQKQQNEQVKMEQTLRVRMAINEARTEQAKQMGDLGEYEAKLKEGASLARERDKLNQDAKERFMKEQEGLILDRVLKNTKLSGENAKSLASFRNMLKITIADPKASDALKLWGKMKYAQINAKDIAGDYQFDDATREKKAEEVYTEFLSRMHEEQKAGVTGAGTDSTKTGGAFDSFIEGLFQ
jgi:hypothetical protein